MIRKKREITQVELFGDWSATNGEKKPSEDRVVRINPSSVHNATEFRKPIQGKTFTDDSSSTELILFDDLVPNPSQETDVQKRIKTDTTSEASLREENNDDLLINKDFADGFDLSSERDSTEVPLSVLNAKKRRNRIWKSVLAVILLGMLLVIFNWNDWILQSSMFILKNIEVRGNDLVSKEEILQWSGLKTGSRLGTIDAGAVSQQLQEKPYFRAVTVTKRYPSSLVIQVEERKPIALIAMNELYPMDENGFILPKLKAVRSYDLPVITGLRAALKTGVVLQSPESTAIRRFLKTAQEKYPALYFEISEVEYTKGGLKVYLNSIPYPLLIDPESVERSLLMMETATEYLKKNIPGKGIREVDLRYDQKMIIRDKTE